MLQVLTRKPIRPRDLLFILQHPSSHARLIRPGAFRQSLKVWIFLLRKAER